MELKARDAIIYASDAFPNPDSLRADFDLFYLLDVCGAIEAAVLYDRLLVVQAASQLDNPLLPALLKEGVAVDYSGKLQVDTSYEAQQSRPFSAMCQAARASVTFQVLEGWQEGDRLPPEVDQFTTAVTAILQAAKGHVIEEHTGVPIVASSFRDVVVDHHPLTKIEQAEFRRLVRSAANVYAPLRGHLATLRAELEGSLEAQLPPIALEVLTRANSPREIGAACLKVRKRYASLRSYTGKIAEVLDDPSMKLGRKLKRYMELERAIAVLLGKSDTTGTLPRLISFAQFANSAATPENMLSFEGAASFGISKVVDKLLAEMANVYWRFKLRPLHSTKRRYLSLDLRTIQKSLRTHFGCELTRRDVDRHRAVERVIAAAFSGTPSRQSLGRQKGARGASNSKSRRD